MSVPSKKGSHSGQFTMEANVPPNFDGKYKIVPRFYYLGDVHKLRNAIFQHFRLPLLLCNTNRCPPPAGAITILMSLMFITIPFDYVNYT